jgi:hypothetical protein
MPEPYDQRQLTTRRDTAHRGAFCRERNPRRVFMKPNRFMGYPVSTDDRRGWHGGVSKGGSLSRDQLAVPGDHDRLG